MSSIGAIVGPCHRRLTLVDEIVESYGRLLLKVRTGVVLQCGNPSRTRPTIGVAIDHNNTVVLWEVGEGAYVVSQNTPGYEHILAWALAVIMARGGNPNGD